LGAEGECGKQHRDDEGCAMDFHDKKLIGSSPLAIHKPPPIPEISRLSLPVILLLMWHSPSVKARAALLVLLSALCARPCVH
jgi:hypothetical protein